MGTLRIKRGTTANRTGITPAQAELVYDTDTKEVYVGDGNTLGGIAVSVSTQNLENLGNVQALTPQKDQLLVYNGSNWAATDNPQLDVRGNIYADDSTLLVDAINGKIVGPVQTSSVIATTFQGTLTGDSVGSHTGSVVGNVVGNVVGTVVGDLKGSVFADDSTVIIDANNNVINATSINATSIDATSISASTITGNLTGNLTGDHLGSVFADDSTLLVDGNNYTFAGASITLNTSVITPLIKSPSGEVRTSAVGANPARITFTRDSVGALATTQSIGRQLIMKNVDGTETIVGSHSMSEETYNWLHAPGGTYDYDNYVTFHKTGKVAISMGQAKISSEPAAHLEVGGAIKPGVYADNTARDAAITSPVAGMIVFNSTGTKFQGYTGSAWVDLN